MHVWKRNTFLCQSLLLSTTILNHMYHIVWIFGRVGEVGESLVVCLILPSKFYQCFVTYIKKANKQEFANVLLAKSFWWEIHQSFPPPKIRAIWYSIKNSLHIASYSMHYHIVHYKVIQHFKLTQMNEFILSFMSSM